ncbi:SIS domain-containing protein [Ferroacidibacillus organovorans]|uniref:SIS domain-containing protein n=1 Tax=Ferroacidibacillus organovorans TaxID=1765683 RepID=A0A101XPS9_9BACL|nr:SIS domain-containing protein [Ferroacidibacillus organovorans]KUO95353.1 hypothetical protein ATW55_10875 [Ferroacidibacillus organovorans]
MKNHTLTEIKNQPASWEQTLKIVPAQWRAIAKGLTLSPQTQFLFIGCGTSFYLAQSASRLFQAVTGYNASAVPASEVFLSDSSVLSRKAPTVAFAISRSGTTSEVLMAVNHLAQHHRTVDVIGVTCTEGSTLTKDTRNHIVLSHAAEKSVVMTQSFTNMLLALQWIAADLAMRPDLIEELERLPELAAQSLTGAEHFGKTYGRTSDASSFIFLGLGAYYGLAAEATLKLKEMTQVPCEYYTTLEFRHGPISIVRASTRVIILADEAHASYTASLVRDVRAVEGQVVCLTTQSNDTLKAERGVFALPDGLSDWSRAVLYMPALHFLAYEKATQLGFDPDAPRNLSQVVIL